MRIDNVTEYRVAKPAMNDFNGFNFQINLQPLFDTDAVLPNAYQPFRSNPAVDNFVEAFLGITLAAQNSNSVSLFYSFFYM